MRHLSIALSSFLSYTSTFSDAKKNKTYGMVKITTFLTFIFLNFILLLSFWFVCRNLYRKKNILSGNRTLVPYDVIPGTGVRFPVRIFFIELGIEPLSPKISNIIPGGEGSIPSQLIIFLIKNWKIMLVYFFFLLGNVQNATKNHQVQILTELTHQRRENCDTARTIPSFQFRRKNRTRRTFQRTNRSPMKRPLL